MNISRKAMILGRSHLVFHDFPSFLGCAEVNPECLGLGIVPLMACCTLARCNRESLEILRLLLRSRADPNAPRLPAVGTEKAWKTRGNRGTST